MKICSVCKTSNPTIEFDEFKNGFCSICKSCRTIRKQLKSRNLSIMKGTPIEIGCGIDMDILQFIADEQHFLNSIKDKSYRDFKPKTSQDCYYDYDFKL